MSKGEYGYYLLYVDENGNEMNDTFHDTLAEALEQAASECHVRDDDWDVEHEPLGG